MQWERDHACRMYGALYTIQRYTSGFHTVLSTVRAWPMSVAAPSLTLSKLQQIDAAEAAHQAGVDERILYPLSHDSMICLVDASSFRCVGCPACPPPLIVNAAARARVALPSATCRSMSAHGSIWLPPRPGARRICCGGCAASRCS